MTKLRSLLLRILAVGHLIWGLLLLLLAARLAWSAFAVLAYLSTGTLWTNLPVAFVLVLRQALPLVALGAWMLILSRRLWSGHRYRNALLVAHGILMLPGVLAVAVGVYALRAAEASAAGGGGLLGTWGVLPLGLGLCTVTLALLSLLLAMTVRHDSAAVGEQ